MAKNKKQNLYQKMFKETLSLPNSQTVKKILNPTVRFQDKQILKDFDEIEVSLMSSIYTDII